MADLHFTLNTGAQIPALGLGTWQGKIGETQKAVTHALLVGYTHIDCGFTPLDTTTLNIQTDRY